jgi:acyl-coenzyme A synthetase/AMP-(fatty) acid ligase
MTIPVMDSETFVTPDDAREYNKGGYWSATETLPGLLARHAAEAPSRLAVVDDAGRRLTYAHLHELSSRVAASLVDRGIARGDVVGIQLPNRVEASIAACAIEKAAAVVCPMVPMYRERELTYNGNKTGMKAIFVGGAYRGYDHDALALRVAEAVPSLKTIITLTEAPHDPRLTSFDDASSFAGDRSQFTQPDLNPDAICAVLFTSGTESDPKGVLHTHNTLLSNNRALVRLLGMGDHDGIFMASPVGHGTGYGFGIRFAVYLGSTLSLLGTWDATRAAELLTEHGAAYTHGATPFVQDLLELPNAASRYDFSRLRYFVSGGATMPPGMWTRVRELLGGCQLLRLYGQTEAFMTTINRPNDSIDRLEETDGLPAPGVQVQVRDDDNRVLGPDEPGELLVRGPHRCVGLLRDPERARTTFTQDGWMRSGDVVRIDSAGYLTVAGRKKEVISRGGYKYSPREVEDVLALHPSIYRVAVVKMPNVRLGEKACAFVVLREGASLDLPTITTFLKEKGVAVFKWPERLEHVDELPTTASGKVQKFVLERRLADVVAGDGTIPSS